MNEMTNKEKEIKYNNKKFTIASISAGALVGNTAFGIWDCVHAGMDCATAVVITGAVTALVTGFSLLKRNPYKEVKVEEVIEEEQPKVKKLGNK